MWGSADTLADASSLVNTVPIPRHSIVFAGGNHWDHARTPVSTMFGCDQDGAGPCTRVGALTADFTALFLTKYLRPEGANSEPAIGDDLRLPQVQLTEDQHFYAGGHLTGLRTLAANPDAACSNELVGDHKRQRLSPVVAHSIERLGWEVGHASALAGRSQGRLRLRGRPRPSVRQTRAVAGCFSLRTPIALQVGQRLAIGMGQPGACGPSQAW